MKLKNSTAWPDYFLRRMVSWICGQLDCNVSAVRSLKLRNRADGFTSGHCYSETGEICVSLGIVNIRQEGTLELKPIKDGEQYQRRTIDELIRVTVHEIAHRVLWLDGERSRVSRRYGIARRASSEPRTKIYEDRVFEAWKLVKESLFVEWLALPARYSTKTEQSITERRSIKAQKDLARWERKLKLAKTKVSKLRTRVKYYRAKELTPEAV